MTMHIEANQGAVADKVLLPGDPLRAKYIAENFLEGATCYNQVRGMFGFTGTYRGERVSIQGTGMGMPSASIYIHELIREYGAKKLVRIGTCGAIRNDVNIRDVIIAQAACTDSAMYSGIAPGVRFSPVGDFHLIKKAYEIGTDDGLTQHVGNVYSSDVFYSDGIDTLQQLGRYGVLAVEMETAALYCLAAKYQVQGLSLLTVSDHVLSGEQTTSLERQTTFNQMIEVALKTVVSNRS
ncbi:purine-nucleoside phosphorylase [Paenibacillus cymbidii]|uniref:purine-nucleoside phosphorylase n=1 Tax=Paenibacillus cymbidii TaxID=1639034 RepID=UPI001081F2DD|nr:purine-nucleoside phosphorylase [Paenibacillus cymbidii]